MIAVQPGKQGRRGLLRLRKVERSIVVRVEHSNRIASTGTRQGRQARER
jgi:hypothetical protein